MGANHFILYHNWNYYKSNFQDQITNDFNELKNTRNLQTSNPPEFFLKGASSIAWLQASKLTKNPPLANGYSIAVGLIPMGTDRVPRTELSGDGSTILYGDGLGFGTLGDQQQFDGVTLWSGSVFGAGSIQARVTALTGLANPIGGVIVRESADANAPFVALARMDDHVRLLSRTQSGAGVVVQDVTAALDSRLRLDRSGGAVACSVDGTPIATVVLPLESWATMGWFVASGDISTDASVTLAEHLLTFTNLPYPADALTPAGYTVHQVRIKDPRDLNNPHITIGGRHILLHRDQVTKALVSAKFSRFVRILGIAGLAAAPLSFVSGSEGDEKLKGVSDKAVQIRQLGDAGTIDGIDKKLEMIELNRMMKEYFDLITGGNPVGDLAFPAGLYKIIGMEEFRRVEGEDP